jgi:hypothetical protein
MAYVADGIGLKPSLESELTEAKSDLILIFIDLRRSLL